MTPQLVFGISVAFSFGVWGIITYQYIWPALVSKPRVAALRPILLLHSFRFVGLAFVVPGVVSRDLPIAFAGPAAYGDLATATLALLALATLQQKAGVIVVWAFQRSRQCGSPLRVLSRRSDRRWARAGPSGCDVLHSDCTRAAATHHARPCVSIATWEGA